MTTPETSTKESRAADRVFNKIKRLAVDRFGIEALRVGQMEVIKSVLDGVDTLALMPTGAGKSLCYQVPALMLPGLTVVVSPLISLMRDQVGKLEQAGIKAIQVNSGLTSRDQQDAIAKIERTRSVIIFTTPERLTDPDFIASLQHNPVSLFVVDEAHCISQWGHDFRPAYLALSAAIDALGRPPVLALTATATDQVSDDIVRQLGLKSPRRIDTGMFRANLHYQVIQTTNDDEKQTAAIELIRQSEGPGIVYAATVKAVKALHHALVEAGENVTLYHGKLRACDRRANQDLFMNGAARVMVATNAFGMGIDKLDTRFVIHYQMPGTLEAYYQESGRAGRDGEAAQCTLLFHEKDKQVQQFFLARHNPGPNELRAVYETVATLIEEKRDSGGPAIAKALEPVAPGAIKVTLNMLKGSKLLAQNAKLQFRLGKRKRSADVFDRLAETFRAQHEHNRGALQHVVSYAQSGFCRWQMLLDYFGEPHTEHVPCGACDNCKRTREHAYEAPLKIVAVAHAPVQAPRPPAFEIGAPVIVPSVGAGLVKAIAGDSLTIEFDTAITKTFLSSYVQRAGVAA